MSLQIIIALAMLIGTTRSANDMENPEANSTEHNIPQIVGQNIVEAVEQVMETGELNPNYYPAQRAAKVVQHYINTRYGSPFQVFILQKVHSANAEDVANSGRKYQLEVSVQEILGNSTETFSAEVLFPRGESQSSPQVRMSCEGLEKINKAKDAEAFYQKLKTNPNLLSAQDLPDSHGHIEPDMKPLWHLGIVAASFIMLNESNENTLYNVAQVGNVTQLATESDELKFDYFVLLHDIVSQEIIRWNLQISWSPPEGVKVLQMEKLPHCHECKRPPNTN